MRWKARAGESAEIWWLMMEGRRSGWMVWMVVSTARWVFQSWASHRVLSGGVSKAELAGT